MKQWIKDGMKRAREIGNELNVIEDIEKRAKRSATYCNTMYENLSSKYFTREQKVRIIVARIQRKINVASGGLTSPPVALRNRRH